MDDYNFDLLEGMEPMIFVPGGNPSGSDQRDEYRLVCMTGMMPVFLKMIRLWIVNVGILGSIFQKGLGPFRSDAPVSPPRGRCRNELFSHEDCTDTMPPEHHMALRGMAHVPTSVSDEDEEMPVLALNSEVVCENEQTNGVWRLPLTVCNSQFRSGASDVTLLSEGMTWLGLLSSADVKTGEVGIMSMGLGDQGLDHWRGVIWNPGIVGQQRVYLCYDCLCLMALFRAMRLLIQDWAGWPVWTGMIAEQLPGK